MIRQTSNCDILYNRLDIAKNRYNKLSKISNTFLLLFSNILAGSFKMLVRIANRENPDQAAS